AAVVLNGKTGGAVNRRIDQDAVAIETVVQASIRVVTDDDRVRTGARVIAAGKHDLSVCLQRDGRCRGVKAADAGRCNPIAVEGRIERTIHVVPHDGEVAGWTHSRHHQSAVRLDDEI